MCFSARSLPPLQPLFSDVTAILGHTQQPRCTAVSAVPISRQFNAELFAAHSRASSSSDYCHVITHGGGTVGDHIRVLSALLLHELSIANKRSEKAITSGCLRAADAARVAPLPSEMIKMQTHSWRERPKKKPAAFEIIQCAHCCTLPPSSLTIADWQDATPTLNKGI